MVTQLDGIMAFGNRNSDKGIFCLIFCGFFSVDIKIPSVFVRNSKQECFLISGIIFCQHFSLFHFLYGTGTAA